MTLVLEPRILEEVHAALASAYPEEGCGVLIGRDAETGRIVTRAVALANQGPESRERRYVIAPEQFLAADREARADGLDVVGFFHSHPDHPARPSAFDLEHAWPYYSYVIVSLMRGVVADTTAWRLIDDRSRFEPEAIELARPTLARKDGEHTP